ncbi:MAG TPA: hypothetical protein VI547_08685, partial [Anaerolineales bacterium]|nr:hypothetical protein [Anaerolineales bacterium]
MVWRNGPLRDAARPQRGEHQMATKKSAGKKKTAKRKPARKSAPKVGVQARNIRAGRDVNIGETITIDNRQYAHIKSAQDFVAELQKLQTQLDALKSQPALPPAHKQTIEAAEEQLKEAMAEAGKPQPLGARITATLTGAKAVMDSLAGSVASAV